MAGLRSSFSCLKVCASAKTMFSRSILTPPILRPFTRASSPISGWPLAILIPLVNLPFLFIGYRHLGRLFAVRSALGIGGLAMALAFIHFPVVPNDRILDAVFGGFFLGAGIGLVLGGSQALGRSLFSQLIPAGREGEYYGFYEISDKGTSWLGPLLFGLVFQLTDSYRLGIVSLVVFFLVGGVLLALVPIRRAIVAAGNTPPKLV